MVLQTLFPIIHHKGPESYHREIDGGSPPAYQVQLFHILNLLAPSTLHLVMERFYTR